MFKIAKASLFIILGLLFLSPAQAQQRERFRIRTYYPSPFGAYHDISTNRLAIGDIPSTEVIKPGVAAFKPDHYRNGEEGQLYFNSSSNGFEYYNGNAWVPLKGKFSTYEVEGIEGAHLCCRNGDYIVGVSYTTAHTGGAYLYGDDGIMRCGSVRAGESLGNSQTSSIICLDMSS